jgi:alpha-L-rhamnosidase
MTWRQLATEARVQLISRQRCWWNVQVWDGKGQESSWSEPSWWEMGLLDPKDWTAQWLAVENEVMRADREADLRWIWGATSEAKGSRKFRFKFSLPAPTRAAELLMVAAPYICKFTGAWIDGVAVKGLISVSRNPRRHRIIQRRFESRLLR